MPAMFQLSSLAVAAAAVRGDPGGCSFAYSASLTYAAGDAVSMTSGASTYNYVCVSGANSAYCNQAAFAPGGQHSGTAWRKESAPCAVSSNGVACAAGLVVDRGGARRWQRRPRRWSVVAAAAIWPGGSRWTRP